jgi:hypothetical protein
MSLKSNYTAFALIMLMALTRVHHFGDAFSVPDASLAVFFLAGLCLRSRALLALLLIEAGGMDYVAIHQFAVSDWCISPAYVFLIPTYATLWIAGRYCASLPAFNISTLAKMLAIAAVATSAAFVISNLSFYLFSGRYSELALSDYSLSVMQYYLPYLSGAMLYTVLGLAIIKMLQVVKESPALLGVKQL